MTIYEFVIWNAIVTVIVMAVVTFSLSSWKRRKMATLTEDLQPVIDKESLPVQYLTIREMRRALQPLLNGDQLDEVSRRMAIRALGLAPVKTNIIPMDAIPTGLSELIVFPGNLQPHDLSKGVGDWAARAISLPSNGRDSLVAIPLECDIYDDALVAAAQPGTPFVGEFPPEWQEVWDKGEKVGSKNQFGAYSVD
jgi:hypothetical protein